MYRYTYPVGNVLFPYETSYFRASFPPIASTPHLYPHSVLSGANGNAQQIYELTFILWTLSLGCEEKDLASFLQAGAIRVLFDLISAAPTRKVQNAVESFLK